MSTSLRGRSHLSRLFHEKKIFSHYKKTLVLEDVRCKSENQNTVGGHENDNEIGDLQDLKYSTRDVSTHRQLFRKANEVDDLNILLSSRSCNVQTSVLSRSLCNSKISPSRVVLCDERVSYVRQCSQSRTYELWNSPQIGRSCQWIGHAHERLSVNSFNRPLFFRTFSSLRTNHNLAVMPRSYEDAVNTLNTLQSNVSVLEMIRSTNDKWRDLSLPETIEMCHRVGLSVEDVDNLSMIHVSGTKGKGSTCAMCESILRAHGFKTGFYSSPHLVEVRERIRLNGRSLSRELFARYFWECYDKLNNTKEAHNGAMPGYFRFLTIMAFYVFRQEKIDVAVVEVGIGGEYDCTNIVRSPMVCGVSSLGIDHTSILGDTIEKIAWHKGGIFKAGVPAVTVPQTNGSLTVLRDRAVEIGCPLFIAPALDAYSWNGRQVSLGIPGGVQQTVNASLALQLCHFYFQDRGLGIDDRKNKYRTAMKSASVGDVRVANVFQPSAQFSNGLESCVWPGRYQKIAGPNVTYYLDGAHTDSSIDACADWFKVQADTESETIQ